MGFWVITLGCVSLGFYIGWLSFNGLPSNCISRYYMKDQQDFERSQAYFELMSRIEKVQRTKGVDCL